MKEGTVTLNEVIEAFKFLGGKAKSRQVEDYIIEARGGILPDTYSRGGWDSYRKTINQMIQFHCDHYAKYRGPGYFNYLGPGKYELISFVKTESAMLVESRQLESHEHAHKTKIDEKKFEELLEKKKEIGALGERVPSVSMCSIKNVSDQCLRALIPQHFDIGSSHSNFALSIEFTRRSG